MPLDTVGVIGLGRMGGNMARCLLNRCFEVVGTDVNDDALADFVSAGGQALSSPAAVASTATVVITSLPDPATVEAVYDGADGLLEGAADNLTVLETSSIDPDTMASLAARAADREIDVLGAPVSGGPTASREGTLTVIVGGDRDVFERESVAAVLDTLGSTVFHTGDIETGHTIKLLNNVVSMGNLLLAMEALALGAARGVDGEIVLEVLENAGGASNQLHKRGPQMLNRNFDPGFTIDLAAKDLGLALETAAETNQPMVLTPLVYNRYLEASARGHGTEDAAAVVKLFEAAFDGRVEADRQVDESYDGY